MTKLGARAWRARAPLGDDEDDYDDRGAEYEGEWLLGPDGQPASRCGAGRLERPDGTLYAGWFRANRFHGYGELTYAEDDAEGRKQYAGLFADGLPHGQGTLLMQDGCHIFTEFEEGALPNNGYGRSTCTSTSLTFTIL